MGIVSYLISLVVVGLFIGALGRLAVPGRNPMSLGRTMFIGIIGAVVGATVGGVLGLGFVSIFLEVGISAGLVYAASGRHGRKQLPRGTW